MEKKKYTDIFDCYLVFIFESYFIGDNLMLRRILVAVSVTRIAARERKPRRVGAVQAGQHGAARRHLRTRRALHFVELLLDLVAQIVQEDLDIAGPCVAYVLRDAKRHVETEAREHFRVE